MFEGRGWYAFQEGDNISVFFVSSREGYSRLESATENIRDKGSLVGFAGKTTSAVKRQFSNAKIYGPKDWRQNRNAYGISTHAQPIDFESGYVVDRERRNPGAWKGARGGQAETDWDKAWENRVRPGSPQSQQRQFTQPPGGRHYGPAMAHMYPNIGNIRYDWRTMSQYNFGPSPRIGLIR